MQHLIATSITYMTFFQSADYAKYSHLQGPTFYAKTEVKVICLCCIIGDRLQDFQD